MAYVELNWQYMHERVNKFIHSVIDNIKEMSPQDRAGTTWHKDLGNVSDNVFVSLIAFYYSESSETWGDDLIEQIEQTNDPCIFLIDDDVYILQFSLRRTTTSAMNEEYDYSFIQLKDDDTPLCEDHSMYYSYDDYRTVTQMNLIDDIGRANNYTLDELYTNEYDLV